MKTYYESLFHTGWFVESILTQTLIVHIIRTNRIPFFQSIASPFLLLHHRSGHDRGRRLALFADRDYFGFVPLPRIYWLWIAGFLLCYSCLTHS